MKHGPDENPPELQRLCACLLFGLVRSETRTCHVDKVEFFPRGRFLILGCWRLHLTLLNVDPRDVLGF